MEMLEIYGTKIEFDDSLKYGCINIIRPIPCFSQGGYDFLKKAGFIPPRYEFAEFPATDLQDPAKRIRRERFLECAKILIDLNRKRLEDISEYDNISGEDRIACKNANDLVQRIISALSL